MAANANYAILNPLTKGTASVLSGGNLIHDGNTTATATVQSSLGVNSGKWYCEVYINTLDASAPLIGIGNGMEDGSQSVSEGQFIVLRYATGNSSAWLSFATDGGSHPLWGTYSENEANLAQYSSGNILMMALDVDNKKLWFGKNGTWYNSGSPADNDGNWQQSWTGTPGHIHFATQTYNNAKDTWNFGQDDTFGGVISATGNADGNGFGVFKYSPPTGFLALCSANLPISDDIDPAQTDDDYVGGKQFNAITYTGTGSSNAITGLGFQPDLVWVKERGAAGDHKLTDSSRGVTKSLESNDTTAEATDTNGLTAFGSDGFTVGSDAAYNNSSDTYVGWAWRCAAGTTSTNSDGSIDSTVQANTKAGFSIVETPSYSGTPTFGHGLSKSLDFIIVKLRASVSQWIVYHSGLSDAGKILYLNTYAAEFTNGAFNSTAPTSSVFSLGAGFAGSGTGIAYCWHSVEGYSKFGKYTGNGNADGPFIYTGFRPRMVFEKAIDTSNSRWTVQDSARSIHNPAISILNWDESQAEYDATSRAVDIYSNGFKIRTSDVAINQSGNDYIYGAWGDVPFKYNNTF
jgi:hypothetical protein